MRPRYKLRIGDVVSGGIIRKRSTVIRQKTARPVQFEIMPEARKRLKHGSSEATVSRTTRPPWRTKAPSCRPARDRRVEGRRDNEVQLHLGAYLIGTEDDRIVVAYHLEGDFWAAHWTCDSSSACRATRSPNWKSSH